MEKIKIVTGMEFNLIENIELELKNEESIKFLEIVNDSEFDELKNNSTLKVVLINNFYKILTFNRLRWNEEKEKIVLKPIPNNIKINIINIDLQQIRSKYNIEKTEFEKVNIENFNYVKSANHSEENNNGDYEYWQRELLQSYNSYKIIKSTYTGRQWGRHIDTGEYGYFYNESSKIIVYYI